MRRKTVSKNPEKKMVTEPSPIVAKVLTEALPYIRTFQRKTMVVKYGGNAMTEEHLKNSFASDIALLKLIGINPIVVHGGGPQISKMLSELKIDSEFVDGNRVTDLKTMAVVEMVLGGQVNKEIVSLINRYGGKAIGLTGKDGNLLLAKKALFKNASGERTNEPLDLGQVGEITQVQTQVLTSLIESNFIPVVAPIAIGEDGSSYNVNADTAAAKIAEFLNASKLILLTNVKGILDSNGETIKKIDKKEVSRLINSEVINEGMIPKVRGALEAIEAGVDSVQIIDGSEQHALLLELFTDDGIGSQLT